MKVYLVSKETKQVIGEYKNVISWGYNFVEFHNGGRCKIYCNENEYFTDKVEDIDDDIFANENV